MVVKKYKLADQNQFNQKIAYKGPALAPRDINSIFSKSQGKPNLSLWIVTAFLQKYVSQNHPIYDKKMCISTLQFFRCFAMEYLSELE